MTRRPFILKSLFLLGFCTTSTDTFAASDGWTIHQECRHADRSYFDGDSFALITKDPATRRSFTYVFRLYGADCPESSATQTPERVTEQAVYFNVSEANVIKWGLIAKHFTARALQGNVTVHTRRHKARGQSRASRYFAMIECDGHDLAALLVANGLARAYGLPVAWKGLTKQEMMNSLKRLETDARKRRLGIWSDSES